MSGIVLYCTRIHSPFPRGAFSFHNVRNNVPAKLGHLFQVPSAGSKAHCLHCTSVLSTLITTDFLRARMSEIWPSLLRTKLIVTGSSTVLLFFRTVPSSDPAQVIIPNRWLFVLAALRTVHSPDGSHETTYFCADCRDSDLQ